MNIGNGWGNFPFLAEADNHEEPPSFWSRGTREFFEDLKRRNEELAADIALSRKQGGWRSHIFKQMEGLLALFVQVQRMVGEGVFVTIMRREFWIQYKDVGITTTDAVTVIKAVTQNIRVYEELAQHIAEITGRADLAIPPGLQERIREALNREKHAEEVLVKHKEAEAARAEKQEAA